MELLTDKGLSQGWHKIAWAFLKPVGKNGERNTDQRLRLQLFYPHTYGKNAPHVCPVYKWWKSKHVNKYPSTLYVTIKAIAPLQQASETLRSKTPIQAETGTSHLLAESNLLAIQKSSPSPNAFIPDTVVKPSWSRLPHQTCKIPNTWVQDLPSFEEGCFVMKFSCSGLYLACAVLIDSIYSIVIYSVLNYTEVYRYSVHQCLIYCIVWTPDDKHIITASADCTVSIWSFQQRGLVDMLPHPTHVYTSDINRNGLIATGCYDSVVRFWRPVDLDKYELVGELEGHKGYVTSLCFSSKHDSLYSSDSVGVVIEWEKTEDENWILKRQLKWMDLKGTIINQIVLHKRGRRLLIHARDGSLRLIDLKTGATLQWLQKATTNRTICCFSACGTYIFCGGTYVQVWNVDLGRLVASYTPFSSSNTKTVTVHCVQFHPHDNILVMSHYGRSFPILVGKYNADDVGKNNRLGLCLLQKENDITENQTLSESKNKKIKENCSKKYKSPKIDAVMEKMNQVVISSSNNVNDVS